MDVPFVAAMEDKSRGGGLDGFTSIRHPVPSRTRLYYDPEVDNQFTHCRGG